MRIGILSRNPALYSTRRLAQAARARGHRVNVIDTMTVAVEMGIKRKRNKGIKVIAAKRIHNLSGKQQRPPNPKSYVKYVPQVDAIIPRIGTSITHYGLAVVRHFESQGVLTTAASQAVAHSRDKLHSLQLMGEAGIPIPKTTLIAQPEALFAAIHAVGGLPVVIKMVRGTQGQGVILAKNYGAAKTIFMKLRRLQEQALVQEFIAEARGRDVRVIVVGNRCIVAMERRAAAGEFRANLHRGGTAVAITPTKTIKKLALAAARAHGLAVAGVDILESKRGPLLLEVNSSPGLKGIERVSNVDVATEIIRFLEEAAAKKNGRAASKRTPRRK